MFRTLENYALVHFDDHIKKLMQPTTLQWLYYKYADGIYYTAGCINPLCHKGRGVTNLATVAVNHNVKEQHFC